MNEDNTRKLIDKYEFLKRSLKTEEGQTMYSPFQMYLFELEDGWYNLLDSTFGEMLNAAKHPDEIYVTQVKEKWAGLRLYFNCNSDDYDALSFIVDQAELQSYKICEICGKEGSVRDLIGYQTLCEQHYQEKQNYYMKLTELMGRIDDSQIEAMRQDYYKRLTEEYRKPEKVDSDE